MLRAKFFTQEQVEAIVCDYRTAGLSAAEVEILDVALTVAARNFISKTLDAVGAEPDAEYLQLDEQLRQTLAVGRPFGPPGSGGTEREAAHRETGKH